MNDEKTINDNLKRFGTNISGKQLFRVSWSDKQIEVRRREYNEFYGKLFVRTVRETAECIKYPSIKERWILEKWIPPDSCYTDEVVSARVEGSYECIYIFQDIHTNYLPLNLLVAQIVVKSLLEPGTIGKRTEVSELAMHLSDKKEEADSYESIMELYEDAAKINMKYPDGTSASKNLDGLKIVVP